jgi:anti-sigma factor RsiW
MLTCREAVSRLADLEAGELGPGEKRETERHLAGCHSCLSYWKSYRTTVALARHACSEGDARGLPMPEGLTRRILDAIRIRPRSKPVFHVVHLLSGVAAAPLLAFWLR